MGHVKEAYGLQGWVRIHSYSADRLSLLDYETWWQRKADAGWRPVQLAEVAEHSGAVVARFDGVVERNGAAALRGTQIAVSRAMFAPTAEHEYYWSDLIGMQVVDRAGQVLGAVDTLQELGPHQVLEVARADGVKGNLLIPFIAQFIDSVSVAEKTIRVDWSEDAADDEADGSDGAPTAKKLG
jgi:16S rRNA processing protein RimM